MEENPVRPQQRMCTWERTADVRREVTKQVGPPGEGPAEPMLRVRIFFPVW